VAYYIGYYHPNPDFWRESGERARNGDGPSAAMGEKVVNLRDNLPKGLKLLGSFAPIGGATAGRPAVWLAETDDTSHLQFVSNWYQGFLDFEWVPATAVGLTAQQAKATIDQNTANR
jgi:hypothetical protein